MWLTKPSENVYLMQEGSLYWESDQGNMNTLWKLPLYSPQQQQQQKIGPMNKKKKKSWGQPKILVIFQFLR